jgi:hypothetical protein
MKRVDVVHQRGGSTFEAALVVALVLVIVFVVLLVVAHQAATLFSLIDTGYNE